jgi:hypothetical protein
MVRREGLIWFVGKLLRRCQLSNMYSGEIGKEEYKLMASMFSRYRLWLVH